MKMYESHKGNSMDRLALRHVMAANRIVGLTGTKRLATLQLLCRAP
jgi:hypothetical protein